MSFEVPKYRLLALLKAEAELKLLEDYGVDNWDWYKDAIMIHLMMAKMPLIIFQIKNSLVSLRK